MSWFQKLLPSRIRTKAKARKNVPEGLWAPCPHCNTILFREDLKRQLFVCSHCHRPLRLKARDRLALFLDDGQGIELDATLISLDPLKFKDTQRYRDRLKAAQEKTSEYEALLVMHGHLYGQPVVAMAFEFDFIGGSMGTVVGEKFVRGCEYALQHGLPVVTFACSGGARMQEGLHSLMQMAKTSAVIGRLRQHQLPYLCVMVDPCMGGVSASLATLGDILIAEPHARIGFAGQLVSSTRSHTKNLPHDFQTAEFLLRHGMIDMIVPRARLREDIARLLRKMCHLEALPHAQSASGS